MKVAVAAVALLVAASVAGARPLATPGVSSSSILIGGTVPLTGEAAAAAGVARGADAYFKYVNAKGGVFNRKITYKYLDDGYEPQRTFLDVRQLVQQDGVFAIFNSLGTSNNSAIRGFLNQAGVPQLFVASGASTFGRDYKKYPWTIGFIPTYSGEGKVYARYLLAKRPGAKIAVLYQDDDYGKELVSGLQAGLGAKKSLIVKKVGYDPSASDVRSEVASLKASKAKVFMIFAFGKFAVQAFITANQLGWHPQIVVNDVAAATSLMQLSPPKATEGAISIVFGKDPDAPMWKRDKGMKLFRSIMARYASGQTPNGYYAAGMASAYTLVDTLKKAGKNLTRKSVLTAATHLNEKTNPFVLPGIKVHTTPSFRFPISQVRLERWHKGHWVIFGPLLSAKP
ncbi:MAG: branched-chain amino acid ABC transporter substrate-binding protein [Actinobacteria bacterium]|nr:MAG: branched-chain amino acid ABC transporter substrate-binding protein [Actinomycetota bacterium]